MAALISVAQAAAGNDCFGQLQLVHRMAGREEGGAVVATLAVTLIGRVEKLQRDLGGRKAHAVQLEIAGLLHLACADGNVGNDGLADVGLPDAHGAQAIGRDAGRVDETGCNGEGADRRRQVAAVSGPVHEVLFDGDLAEEVDQLGENARRAGDIESAG
jgi:hypothetical protein